MANLTPRQIVDELNKHIIGQDDAKRAVAIALRNRYRRSRLPEEMRDEITPKNIIMSGPTGVGKTEIARRLSKLMKAPFVKVEATKFTEVGYVGRDVESMVRDLVEASIRMVKQDRIDMVQENAKKAAEELAKEGVSCEVIDLISLLPLDYETVMNSIGKTNRVVVCQEANLRGGMAGDIVSEIIDRGFDLLDAPPVRVGALNVPMPYNKGLEDL